MLEVPEKVDIKDMHRNWWIKYRWENVTTVADSTVVYIRCGFRPIEEAEQAGRDFDIFVSNFRFSNASEKQA